MKIKVVFSAAHLHAIVPIVLTKNTQIARTSNVPGWKTIEVEREQSCQRVMRAAFQQNNERISDLISNKSVVAVASGDRGNEYYLLKVTHGSHTLGSKVKVLLGRKSVKI